MTQELQDKLKLVMSFIGWKWDDKFVGYLSGKGGYIEKSFRFDNDWSAQIPVWAKLNEKFPIGQIDHMRYAAAVRQDDKLKGFEIIVTIIQRIQQ